MVRTPLWFRVLEELPGALFQSFGPEHEVWLFCTGSYVAQCAEISLERMVLDTRLHHVTTGLESLDACSLAAVINCDSLEADVLKARKLMFPDDLERCGRDMYVLEEREGEITAAYHPECFVCQLREAVREPVAFATLGKVFCRSLNFSQTELELAKAERQALIIEGAYAH